MAAEYSFDVVSRVEMAEVQNAVNQVAKEVATRFDLRGGQTRVDLDAKAGTVTLTAEAEHQCQSLLELLQQRLAKRGVSLRALEVGPVQPVGGDLLRQTVTLRQGIPQEKASEMCRLLRENKIKVTGQIQRDQVRVTGAKKDDLQLAIRLLRERDFGLELQFINYR